VTRHSPLRSSEERKERSREYRERLQWESLAGLADCSFIESLNDYKWSRSSLRSRYDLTKRLRVVCVTQCGARGHANLESLRSCPRRERERERERPPRRFSLRPLRNQFGILRTRAMQVEKTRFRFQEVSTSTAGDNEIPSASFARGWEWFFMLLRLRVSDEWKLRNKERRQLPIIFLSTSVREKLLKGSC